MTASQERARGFNRLRQWFRPKSGKDMSHKDLFTDMLAGAGMRSYMVMPGQPVWTDRNYYQFALEAYIKNVIAHRAMGMVSGCASSVRMKLYECDANGVKVEIKSHPILDMINHPNPTQAHGEFFQALHQYRLISGNAFIQAVGPSDSPPRELHLLRPDRMAVIAGKNSMPSGYRYTVNGDYTDYPVDRITGRSRILHLKNFHPLNDWYGLSPVEAAAYSIDQHNQSGAWNQALLQNGARPSGALVVRADSTGSGTLSEEQYNRIKLQIDDQFSGAANAGRPILLEGGLDWKEMSISPKDMDFVQAKNAAARDIALAFGVPPQMLGIPGDNTYSNLQEARVALWEQTVIPLVKSTADALNGWLAPMFGNTLELQPDVANISALATKNQALWSMAEAANFLTTDEKRAVVGYGPLPQSKSKKKAKIRREIKIGHKRLVKEWNNDSADDDVGDDSALDDNANNNNYSNDDNNSTSDNALGSDEPTPGDTRNSPTDNNVNPQDPISDDINPLDTWGDPDTLNDHFERHGNDFGAESPQDYAAQANDFYQRAQDEGLPMVQGSDGVTRAYDPDTNTFGSYNSDGTTKTFFQPDDGEPYFQGQINKDLADGGSMINPYNSGPGPESPYGSGTATPELPYAGGGGGNGIAPGIAPFNEELEE